MAATNLLRNELHGNVALKLYRQLTCIYVKPKLERNEEVLRSRSARFEKSHVYTTKVHGPS